MMAKIKEEYVYQCTYCKRVFKTLKRGYKHFDKEKHEFGGLAHLEVE